ncbi:hypothetical protein CEXT_426181 [Caerostris extrusa]|uniref:Uncharacterized protein n=1 Tax=Caerostris extrusa TaxID=172846 RepID=A0AAV4RPN2_CAEEX|nr:hypothetical protein CEXT_426181 [Caerostris extrusa]
MAALIGESDSLTSFYENRSRKTRFSRISRRLGDEERAERSLVLWREGLCEMHLLKKGNSSRGCCAAFE